MEDKNKQKAVTQLVSVVEQELKHNASLLQQIKEKDMVTIRKEAEAGVRGESSVGPFEFVSADALVHFAEVDRTFRVVIYGAYNAFGLIGPEKNGVAVLDEDSKEVVADGFAQRSTGYFGPSQDQILFFHGILDADWDTFRQTVNSSENHRFAV